MRTSPGMYTLFLHESVVCIAEADDLQAAISLGKSSSYLRGATVVAFSNRSDGSAVETCRFMGGLMTWFAPAALLERNAA